MQKYRILLCSCILLLSLTAAAQKTLVYSHQEATYKEALNLFEHEQFSAAQKKFKDVFKSIQVKHSEVKMSAEYYHALCALELFNDDAEALFISFIERYPQSPKIRLARFQLGKFYYRKKEWRHARLWLDQVDVNELEEQDVPEYYFKLAYSNYKIKDFSKAQRYFNEAKQLESIYKSPAIFYYAYLSYKFNFNETALKGFEQLKEDENFGNVVPYYIIQIYYLQKKFDEIRSYGPGLLDNAIPKRAPEIAQIVGEAYYRTDDYVKAVQYFEFFMDKGFYADSSANYKMAYSYLKTNQLEKAIPYFQKASDLETEIGQLSLYYLGDIYLKQNNKQAARNAYRFASKANYNQDIKENALFNYAKLSYELDIDPYHESIIALENYIDQFPNSSRLDEARKYLLNVYLNTKNYQRAIVALDKIQNKDLEVRYAYQKIAFYRGVELFNNERVGFDNKDYTNYKKAIYFFQKSLQFPSDNKITALAHYWKADAYYRMGDMDKALTHYRYFKTTAGAILLPEFQELPYQEAYCFLGKNDYGAAIRYFRKYIDSKGGQYNAKINDAYLRTGDSYLIIKGQDDLLLSLKFYRKVIDKKMASADYAHYQLGQALLLLNKYQEQAQVLSDLVKKYPDSKYFDDANFSLGETYLVNLDQFDLAVKHFNAVVNQPNGDVLLVQKAYNGLATAYQNKKEFEKALGSYENAIALNPRSKIAFEATVGHKAICEFEIGNSQRHFDFRNNVGLPDLSESAKDSSVFNAAKKFYIDEDYPTAIKSLNNYLNSFPKALFVNTANFFLAESYLAQEDYEKALLHYENVIKLPAGEFTERSFYYAAKLHLKQKGYAKAVARFSYLSQNSHYEQYVLEAHLGLMRSFKELSQADSSLKYARLVQLHPKASALQINESMLQEGVSLFEMYKHEQANEVFVKIAAKLKNEMGAEAKYHVAYIKYLKEDYEGSTQEAYALAKAYPSYKYWVTKGFLLVSDNFVKQKDYFQAKYILKTIVSNYQGPDLVNEANDRLNVIEELENAEQKVSELQEEEIKVGDENEENQELYKEEEKIDTNVVEETIIEELDSLPTVPNE